MLAPEIDFHIYGRGDAADRTVRLTAAEWDANHTPRIPGETEWVPLPGSPSFPSGAAA